MAHQGVGNPKVQEIAPGVFVITKLVHFFAKIGVNAGIIHTPKSVIFIDSGMSAFSGAYLWNLAKERMKGDEDLYLILTHKDTDHCFGMNEIKKHGATVISHEHTAEIIHSERDLSKNSIAKRVRKKFHPEDVLGAAILSRPEQTITRDTTLNLGDDVRLLSVPGHTPGDIAVYHPRSKVLFAGDAVLEGMDPYVRPDSISIKTWIKNLERLKELDIEWILPGHGVLSKPDIIDSNILFLMREQR
ncbi:MAG: MBL fold metallo-hydrolase [Candidatus Thorarchaeota archaeon]|jgi:glyoxylase-like metal-dependent hydrolase (beta-lactamase superfamily II)